MRESRNPKNVRDSVVRLPVPDITDTLDFYVGKLGFQPLYRFDGEAGVGSGETIVRFCEGDPVSNEKFSIYFEINNPDELFEEYEAGGVEIMFSPQDEPWGSRDFGIRDPSGHRLIFGDFRGSSKQKRPSEEMATAIEAMMAGDVVGLARLLEGDMDLIRARAPAPYAEDRTITLLHILMDYPGGNHPSNVVQIARRLVDAGSDVDAFDGPSGGSTPLQLLMSIGGPVSDGVELTRLLLECGASASVESDYGMDAFTLALLHGQTKCAVLMYERGYPPNFAWAGAGLGDMDLVRAFFGESDDNRLPAEQRADHLGEEATSSMNCAFLVASINGQTEVVEYLLDKGVDVDMQPPGSDFAGIGATALHWAARHGHRTTVERLVARGANLRARDDVFQLTPAGWAAWYGHEEVKRVLSCET